MFKRKHDNHNKFNFKKRKSNARTLKGLPHIKKKHILNKIYKINQDNNSMAQAKTENRVELLSENYLEFPLLPIINKLILKARKNSHHISDYYVYDHLIDTVTEIIKLLSDELSQKELIYKADAITELAIIENTFIKDFTPNEILSNKIASKAKEGLQLLYNGHPYLRRTLILKYLNYIQIKNYIVPNVSTFFEFKSEERILTEKGQLHAIDLNSINDDSYQLSYPQALPLYYSFLSYDNKIEFHKFLDKYKTDSVFKKDYPEILEEKMTLREFLERAIKCEFKNTENITTFAEDVISYCKRRNIFSGSEFEATISVSRKIYEKCRKDRYYKPRDRNIVLTMCFKFELFYQDSLIFLKKAGFTLADTKYDSIIKVCLQQQICNIDLVNYLLYNNGFSADKELLGLRSERISYKTGF